MTKPSSIEHIGHLNIWMLIETWIFEIQEVNYLYTFPLILFFFFAN